MIDCLDHSAYMYFPRAGDKGDFNYSVGIALEDTRAKFLGCKVCCGFYQGCSKLFKSMGDVDLTGL